MEKVARLIEKFIPENYNLFLDINRKDKSFKGSVTIKGEAKKQNISLHQNELEITTVKIDNENVDFTIDRKNDEIKTSSNKTGNINVYVEFTGNITDNMMGMYPSYYTENGEKKELIATQLASHFARKVFPSIDEPEAKASFDLAIKFDQKDGEIVIANMPEIEIENRKQTGIWKFDTTPKMSTYLLAFAIGDIQSTISETKNGTEVGVFATKAHPAKSLDFALKYAIKSIEFYEDYFGVKYPIPHSYHIALPDFSFGAMENWGLITYREASLLVDENSTVQVKQGVALIIAHEVAHQWFGNLVTMKWWDDLWLNESFANMMEYVAIDNIEPTWNIIENFQTSGLPYALKRDATDGVQSVHIDVNHPDEISSIFDGAIVYAKGSRLMHMLRRWLGDKDFSNGLSKYFEAYKYGNTIGKNLWDKLSEVSGKDVAGFMNCWLDQPGYPVVSAKVENDTLIISQKQFFIGEHVDRKRLWQVPLNCNWQEIPELLTDETIEIANYSELKKANKQPFRLNTENTAHYIVHYKGELLDDLLNNFANIDKVSKLQIIKDFDFLAEGREVTYSELVSLLPLLTNEESYIVNSAIAVLINKIQRFLDDDSQAEKAFKNIIKKIFKANFDKLGFIAKENESDNDEIVRQITLNSLIYAGDEKASSEASEIFKQYQNNLENIPAPIRAVVLKNQIKQNETDELVDTYLDKYVETVDSNFKRGLSSALGETKNLKTIDKVIATLKNKDIVKPQDLAGWYGIFLANTTARPKMWQWACDNWQWLTKSLGGDMSFDKFILIPASIFKTKKRLEEFKKFFEPELDNIAINRSIKMGINEIEARVNLIEQEKAAVEKTILNLTM